MREIKFRVYDEETETMEYEIAIGKGYSKEHYILFLGLGETFIVEDKLKLMQYTGLKDKNGVEIYEYDVLKGLTGLGEEINGFVEYVEDWGRFIVNNNINISKKLCKKLEAIGNIYENKNLLDEVK